MWDLHFEMMRADQRCQVKLSRPHVEISPSPVAGILQMRNSPWPWFSCEDQHGDGKGRYSDNIFVERTVKYEEVYLKAYANVLEAKSGLEDYFRFYKT